MLSLRIGNFRKAAARFKEYMPELTSNDVQVGRTAPPSRAEISQAAVREQLRKILDSSSFRDSGVQTSFLKYVVEKKLELLERDLPEKDIKQALKATVIAIDVFKPGKNSSSDVELSVRVNAGRLRDRLEDYYSGEGTLDPIQIELPKPGYVPIWHRRGELPTKLPRRSHTVVWTFVISASVLAALFTIRGIRHTPLTSKDTIVLGAFENRTGDDDLGATLKEALKDLLEQSPFLKLESDNAMKETLKMMGRPPNEQSTNDTIREACERTGAKALVAGLVAPVGDHYLVSLRAENCQTGDNVASAEAEAENRNKMLTALNIAGTALRKKLGESLASVEQFSTLDQATTPRFEALRAYTLGHKQVQAGDLKGAIQYYQRAIELDPTFARAYAALGITYGNLDEADQATQNIKTAYDLRSHVSQRERFYIESAYYTEVTGQLEKAVQIFEEYIQAYPREYVPHMNMAASYALVGQYAKAADESQQAITLYPDDVVPYVNLMGDYICLNRRDKARSVFDAARTRKLDSPQLRLIRYLAAYLDDDTAAMQEQIVWARSNGAEDTFLSAQSDTEAYQGRFAKARDLSRQALKSAPKDDPTEAAGWLANEALREAEIGNLIRARQVAADTLALSSEREVAASVALTFARAGDIAKADQLANMLSDKYPLDTVMQNYTLPTIRAAIALQKNRPNDAIDMLRVTALYELGNASLNYLYPAYVRGQAYLALEQGPEAATEFQRVLDNRGIVLNFVTGSLARLQLARAQSMSGDRTAAQKSYRDFLNLWRDADPDIPIFKQAKSEYAKLQ